MKTNDLKNANSQPNENELRTKKIYKELKEFDEKYYLDFKILDYTELQDLENIDNFEDLEQHLEENEVFNIDIIYYKKAMEYLQENDASLYDSVNLALEHGYKLEDIHSELLASLLASTRARELFNEWYNEINEILTKNN